MSLRPSLEVRFTVADDATASILARVLETETYELPPRMSVRVAAQGPLVVLNLEADELRGLRAGTNSYLRWASTALETVEAARAPRQ